MPTQKIEIEFSSKLGDTEIRVKHDVSRYGNKHYITLQENEWGSPLMIPIDMIPIVIYQMNQLHERLVEGLRSDQHNTYPVNFEVWDR